MPNKTIVFEISVDDVVVGESTTEVDEYLEDEEVEMVCEELASELKEQYKDMLKVTYTQKD